MQRTSSGRIDPEAQAKISRKINEQQENEALLRVFGRLDTKDDKKIDLDELHGYLKFLGYKCSKKETADIIWEVDEDCDKCITWEEFKQMYRRVRNDKSGWEPRRLFNVVEFMMHDKDGSGQIDIDECMEILFSRFGKESLEDKVEEFMSRDEDSNNQISLTEFLNMDRLQDQGQMAKHPGFRLSQGMVETTRIENQRIMSAMAGRS